MENGQHLEHGGIENIKNASTRNIQQTTKRQHDATEGHPVTLRRHQEALEAANRHQEA